MSYLDYPDPEDPAPLPEYTQCPNCGSENDTSALMGQLGDVNHYRCRSCGWNYHTRED